MRVGFFTQPSKYFPYIYGPVRRERKAGQLFRLATVSHIKMVVLPFRNGRKRSLCMGERNGTVPPEQALRSLYYQSKFFTYYVTRHKDYSVFHELCDLYCLIGVRVLSYRSSEVEVQKRSLEQTKWLPAPSLTRRREDCYTVSIIVSIL